MRRHHYSVLLLVVSLLSSMAFFVSVGLFTGLWNAIIVAAAWWGGVGAAVAGRRLEEESAQIRSELASEGIPRPLP